VKTCKIFVFNCERSSVGEGDSTCELLAMKYDIEAYR